MMDIDEYQSEKLLYSGNQTLRYGKKSVQYHYLDSSRTRCLASVIAVKPYLILPEHPRTQIIPPEEIGYLKYILTPENSETKT